MADCGEIRKVLSGALDEEERTREVLYRSSRDLIKKCRDFISRTVHQGPIDEETILIKIRDLTDKDLFHYPFVEDSLTEAAEAVLLTRLVKGEELPLPSEVGLPERAYALGACDAVGEMRRIALNRILDRDVEGAMEAYRGMKDLYSLVEGLTYPSGMIQLKRKQDVARASLDRTLGEITVAMSGMKEK
jgi:translin